MATNDPSAGLFRQLANAQLVNQARTANTSRGLGGAVNFLLDTLGGAASAYQGGMDSGTLLPGIMNAIGNRRAGRYMSALQAQDQADRAMRLQNQIEEETQRGAMFRDQLPQGTIGPDGRLRVSTADINAALPYLANSSFNRGATDLAEGRTPNFGNAPAGNVQQLVEKLLARQALVADSGAAAGKVPSLYGNPPAPGAMAPPAQPTILPNGMHAGQMGQLDMGDGDQVNAGVANSSVGNPWQVFQTPVIDPALLNTMYKDAGTLGETIRSNKADESNKQFANETDRLAYEATRDNVGGYRKDAPINNLTDAEAKMQLVQQGLLTPEEAFGYQNPQAVLSSRAGAAANNLMSQFGQAAAGIVPAIGAAAVGNLAPLAARGRGGKRVSGGGSGDKVTAAQAQQRSIAESGKAQMSEAAANYLRKWGQ